MAPTTAFSGRNISEDSLAISTAILAAQYDVCQPVSFLIGAPPLDVWDNGRPLDVSDNGRPLDVSGDGRPTERAMELDEAASTVGSRCDVRSRTRSTVDVGVETEMSARCFDLRRGILRWWVVDGSL